MSKGIYKRTEEHKKKLSESHKGKSSGAKGKHWKQSEETKRKISKFQQGKKRSEETKRKMSLASKKKPKSEEHRRKLKESHTGKIREKASNWQGGKSFEPYSVDWTKTLRQSIRERDKYTCQLCKEKQRDRAFSIHHIDYNKLNCDPNNLITLCVGCNSKVNFNRNYWIEYFIIKKYDNCNQIS